MVLSGQPLFRMSGSAVPPRSDGELPAGRADNGAKSKAKQEASVSEANPARIFQSGEPEFQTLPAWAQKVLA